MDTVKKTRGRKPKNQAGMKKTAAKEKVSPETLKLIDEHLLGLLSGIYAASRNDILSYDRYEQVVEEYGEDAELSDKEIIALKNLNATALEILNEKLSEFGVITIAPVSDEAIGMEDSDGFVSDEGDLEQWLDYTRYDEEIKEYHKNDESGKSGEPLKMYIGDSSRYSPLKNIQEEQWLSKMMFYNKLLSTFGLLSLPCVLDRVLSEYQKSLTDGNKPENFIFCYIGTGESDEQDKEVMKSKAKEKIHETMIALEKDLPILKNIIKNKKDGWEFDFALKQQEIVSYLGLILFKLDFIDSLMDVLQKWRRELEILEDEYFYLMADEHLEATSAFLNGKLKTAEESAAYWRSLTQDDAKLTALSRFDARYREIADFIGLNSLQQFKVLFREQIDLGYRKGEHYKVAIFNGNLRLVITVAKELSRGNQNDLMDLIQEGNIGLMTAIDKYDYTKNLKFSTYATWWIQQAIRRYQNDGTRTIRIPMHINEEIRAIKEVMSQAGNVENIAMQNGEIPESFILEGYLRYKYQKDQYKAKQSEIRDSKAKSQFKYDYSVAYPQGYFTPEIVEKYRKAIHTALSHVSIPYSLENSINDNDEGSTSHIESLVDTHHKLPDENLFAGQMGDLVLACIGSLDEREQTVLIMRYGIGLNTEHTLERVGEVLGVTRERVRQIEKKALSSLKSRFALILKPCLEDGADADFGNDADKLSQMGLDKAASKAQMQELIERLKGVSDKY